MSKKSLLEKIASKIADCGKCKLCEGKKKKGVPGKGNSEANVMLIGEAPGHMEEIKGEPFVGAAGKFLDKLLSHSGLSREEVYITNVVKCRPAENRELKSNDVASCGRYLDKEIDIIQPKLIVTLGKHSTAYILSKTGLEFSGITKIHGKLFATSLLGLHVNVFSTFHPAAALYNPKYKEMLQSDFEKLGKIVRGEDFSE